MSTLTKIGIIVDAGATLGYGHAVRCLRLAAALEEESSITFYPMSEPCASFLQDMAPNAEIRSPKSEMSSLPPVVITDLREAHGITATIRRNGSRHISIHDLGLAQVQSDVVIDGSITRLFPYIKERNRTLFLGPKYMISRNRVRRSSTLSDTVLVTFGGGSTANFAAKVSEEVWNAGLTPVTTRGFVGTTPMSDEEFAEAMATCRFAISGSGVTLYDLLASGVPTIAAAFDRIQLRTADAFHERGAVLSAGLIQRLSPGMIQGFCKELLGNRALNQRLSEAGQVLVDGKGLSRVVEIVRRQLWLTSQMKTYSAC